MGAPANVGIQETDATRGRGPAVRRDASKRALDGVFWLAVVAVLGTYVRVWYFTPNEARQGPAQKIFYIHVPAAITALYLAFLLMAVASVLYLWLRDLKLDRVAASAAEVGLVYTTVVLTTGPLWAKPVWGTWWSWDARLTSTLFLWLIILGYLLLRNAVDDQELRARYSAVLAILAGILVPFIHLTVYMFRTLHPQPIVLKPSAPSLPSDMLITFVLSVSSFALLGVALIRSRYRLALLGEPLESHGSARGGR